jgi:NADH-quinone oxidoreductase subunit M
MFGTWNTTFSYVFPFFGGTFHLSPWVLTMVAATGVIWAAVYLLWMLQRVLFGRVTRAENRRLADLNWREIGLLLPLLALMLYMGAYPRPFLERSRASVEQVRTRVLGGESQGAFPVRTQAAK